MPELPEVERGRRLAESVGAGRRIEHVWCDDDPIVFDSVGPRRWRRALQGKCIEAARRWGKQLWLELTAPPHPLFHFGMTGGFKTPVAEPLQLKSGTARGPDGVAASFREDPDTPRRRWRARDDPMAAASGASCCATIRNTNHPFARLGFDPLLAMPTSKRFSEMIRGRSGNVKSLLLDQSFVAGVGNWIADEVLLPGRDRSPAPGVVVDGRGSTAGANQTCLDRQARGSGQRRRFVLSAHMAVPPALGQARRRDDVARRTHRASDDRRAHHRVGADGTTLNRHWSRRPDHRPPCPHVPARRRRSPTPTARSADLRAAPTNVIVAAPSAPRGVPRGGTARCSPVKTGSC